MTKRKTKPFWQIEKTAKNYLELHNCFDEPYKGIDFIIESCGIDLIPLNKVSNNNLLGFFGNNGKEKFIAYNSKLIPERILFTKAHELGHFVLNHNLKSDIVTETTVKSKDPQETEANVFAASLLMPKQVLCPFLTSINYDTNTLFDDLLRLQKQEVISLVCDRFKTSKQATYFRLKNLSKT